MNKLVNLKDVKSSIVKFFDKVDKIKEYTLIIDKKEIKILILDNYTFYIGDNNDKLIHYIDIRVICNNEKKYYSYVEKPKDKSSIEYKIFKAIINY